MGAKQTVPESDSPQTDPQSRALAHVLVFFETEKKKNAKLWELVLTTQRSKSVRLFYLCHFTFDRGISPIGAK